jgi:tRNA A-37 threonylcarbamoyl transferase component Bud32
MTDGIMRVVRRGPAWSDALAGALAAPAALLARPGTRMFKHRDAGRTVGLVSLGGAEVVIKLYEEVGIVDRAERLLFGSPAARAASGIDLLGAAGFGAPELIAVLESAPGAVPLASALVTVPVGGARADDAFGTLRTPARLEFAAALGAYVRALHERGIYPQDLWMTNLIAAPSPRQWSWVLVDVDRVRAYRRLSWKRRRKNLVQIERSLGRIADPAERQRFLESYLATADADEVRRVGREIVGASRRKDAAHGGPR